MNQDQSVDSATTSPLGPDIISRRAYELWEKEGRPEGSDLRHWLQAEQELRSNASPSDNGVISSDELARQSATDTRPLQGTRAASAANRTNKRATSSPFNGDRSGSDPSSPPNPRRKPPATRAM
jgi:hypothetical protein